MKIKCKRIWSNLGHEIWPNLHSFPSQVLNHDRNLFNFNQLNIGIEYHLDLDLVANQLQSPLVNNTKPGILEGPGDQFQFCFCEINDRKRGQVALLMHDQTPFIFYFFRSFLYITNNVEND